MNPEIYIKAGIEIFGKRKCEEWFDDNATKLLGNASSVKEAKDDIYKALMDMSKTREENETPKIN